MAPLADGRARGGRIWVKPHWRRMQARAQRWAVGHEPQCTQEPLDLFGRRGTGRLVAHLLRSFGGREAAGKSAVKVVVPMMALATRCSQHRNPWTISFKFIQHPDTRRMRVVNQRCKQQSENIHCKCVPAPPMKIAKQHVSSTTLQVLPSLSPHSLCRWYTTLVAA